MSIDAVWGKMLENLSLMALHYYVLSALAFAARMPAARIGRTPTTYRINNNKQWKAVEEYLKHLKTLELQVLAVATSELEMFRLQGKINSLVRLEQLPEQVKEAVSRKEDI